MGSTMSKKPKHGLGPMLARKAKANGLKVKIQLGPTPSLPGSRLKGAKPKGKN